MHEIGLTLPAKVIRVIDGDTIEVEVRRVIPVRLLDCWAPETRTKDLDEKELGIKSKEHLLYHAIHQDVILEIPIGAEKFGESNSFGRVLGRVRRASDNVDLSELQVNSGYATKERS